MMSYSWPGNVRELYNIIERSLILHSGSGLLSVQLDTELNHTITTGSALSANDQKLDLIPASDTVLTLAQAERQHILQVIKLCNGKISGKKGAASYLDLPVSTLRSRMKKLGI